MSTTAVIILPKLFLWNDATRLQTWPKLLSRVEPAESFASMTDLAKRYISDRVIDKKHPAHMDTARSLAGLETLGQRLLLRGVGLLEKSNSDYQLSAQGVALAAAYRRSPSGDDWVKLLARLLVSREPRLRVLLKLLSGEAACLVFKGGAWYRGPLDSVLLIQPGSKPFEPFNDCEGGRSFRAAVVNDALWALGEWRRHPLLEMVAAACFVGQKKPEFTLDSFGQRIRPALEVLNYLGILRHMGSEAWIDKDVATDMLGKELAADFGWLRERNRDAASPTGILAAEIERLRLDTGFVVASELREALHGRGLDNPDKAIADLIRDGLVVLDGQDYGQERHGRGLYGDPAKQLIRLRINSQQF